MTARFPLFFVFVSLCLLGSARASAEGIQEFTQTLDHFNPADSRTFRQRYLVDSEYASGPNAPVVFLVCPEANCFDDDKGNSAFEFLPTPARRKKKIGAVLRLAKTLGGHAVYLEHRFCGKSQPFELMTGDALKYLSMEQALEDLATFQKWATTARRLFGKWIALGGSYSANLASLYRLVHPELAAGAIASSACLMPIAG